MRIYKTWGAPDTGIYVYGNTALVVPPFLTPGDTQPYSTNNRRFLKLEVAVP